MIFAYRILTRICLEVPLITDDITTLLKEFSSVEVFGLNIIYNLILMRPPKQFAFLSILLENTAHQSNDVSLDFYYYLNIYILLTVLIYFNF